jgi:hypothetical protein
MQPEISPLYATIAQVAATVIGLFGAIYVSRLLTVLENINETKRKVIEDFIDLRGELDGKWKNALSHQFYLKNHRSAIETLAHKAQIAKNEILQIEGQTSLYGTTGDHYLVTPEDRDLTKKIASIDGLSKRLRKFIELNDLSDLNKLIALEAKQGQLMSKKTYWYEHDEEAMYQLSRIARRINVLRKQYSSIGSIVVELCLAWLFVFAVMLPLALWSGVSQVLHIGDYHIRVADTFLVALSIGVIVLLGYLSSEDGQVARA